MFWGGAMTLALFVKKRPYTVCVRPLVCLGTLGSLVRFVGRGGEVFQFFAAVADFLGFLRGVGFEFLVSSQSVAATMRAAMRQAFFAPLRPTEAAGTPGGI